MLTIWHFEKIYILSLAEHSDEHMKYLYLGLSFTFVFVRHDRSLRTPPISGDVQHETKARKPLHVRTTDLFTRKFTSLTLCYYLIGLFNRAQTNHKHCQKEKNVVRMWAAVSLGGALRDIQKKRLRRRLLVSQSICPSVCLSVCLSLCPSVRLSVCPSVKYNVCW